MVEKHDREQRLKRAREFLGKGECTLTRMPPGCAPYNVYSAPCLAVPHTTFIVPHAWLCPIQRL